MSGMKDDTSRTGDKLEGRNSSGQFAKGHKNIGGRPPKPDFKIIIETLPQSIKDQLLTCAITGKPVDANQFYVICLMVKAGEGDTRAIKEYGERLFGKVPDKVEMINASTDPRDYSDAELLAMLERSGDPDLGDPEA